MSHFATDFRVRDVWLDNALKLAQVADSEVGPNSANDLAMRKSRRDVLSDTGLFHKMWRGHNRETIFGKQRERHAYIKDLCDTQTDEIRGQVEWYSYHIMSNHTHETGRVKRDEKGELGNALRLFGNWMRNAHSRFGQRYNMNHDRQGKVAYDRPKTTQVRDTPEDMQRTVFYGDANPVRAGIVKHPKNYAWSSYRFYAYGEKDAFTEHLTQPAWYLALGNTKRKRQRRYRQLCDRYLRREGLLNDEPLDSVSDLDGEADQKEEQRVAARKATNARAGPNGPKRNTKSV